MKGLKSFADQLRKFPPGIFFIIILGAAIAWTYLWSGEQNYNFLDSQNFYPEMLDQARIAFREELKFRWLPFTVATLIWLVGVRLKIPSLPLITTLAISIIIVQVILGSAHVIPDIGLRAALDLPPMPSLQEKIQHVMLQGGIGLFFSFAYFKYLLQSKGIWRYVQFLPFIMCVAIHMVHNQIYIYFGYY